MGMLSEMLGASSIDAAGAAGHVEMPVWKLSRE